MQLEEHTDIDLLITRYLSGKMDKESFAELKRWSLESESNRKYVRNKLEVWFSSGVADTAVQFDKDKAFSLFKQVVRMVGNVAPTPCGSLRRWSSADAVYPFRFLFRLLPLHL